MNIPLFFRLWHGTISFNCIALYFILSKFSFFPIFLIAMVVLWMLGVAIVLYFYLFIGLGSVLSNSGC